MDSTETELKLCLDAALLSRVPRLPAIAAHKAGKGRGKTLVSTYYDTPARELRQNGVSLRLRQSGRDWTQTVKTEGQRASGLFERGEWEIPAPLAQVHLPHLLATELPVFRLDGLTERLAPVFTTRVHRTTYLLTAPEWDIELALDQGEIQAGDARMALAEIELELRRGPVTALFALAQDIAAAFPCRILTSAKSDRGYTLADGGDPRPSKAPALDLDAVLSAGQAFSIIAGNCLRHLQSNEAALRGDQAGEAVHQMRVALRRLRSALKVFKPLVRGPELDALKTEMRWLLDHLGPARDADVFLAEIIAPVQQSHPDAPALALLREEWLVQRQQAFVAATAAIDDNRFTRLMLTLGQWLAQAPWTTTDAAALSLGRYARLVLKKSYRRLLKAGGDNLAHLPAPKLHQVRILGKQMRYTGEFFATLYPRGQTKPFLGLLAELQESLGGLNDLSVAGTTLAGAHHRQDWAWAAGMICGWHEHRRPALLRDARLTWKKLRKTAPYWE
jgi:triphosphatase